MNLLKDYAKFKNLLIGAGAVGGVAATPEDSEALMVGRSAAGWKNLPNKIASLYDKKTKAEISDYLAKIRPSIFGEKPNTLSDILKHDELYKQYPQLKDMPVKFIASFGSHYDPYDKSINLGMNALTSPKSTILHEVQHAIQHKEGFNRGSNVSEFVLEAVNYKNLTDKMAMAENELKFNKFLKASGYRKEHGDSKEMLGYLADDFENQFGSKLDDTMIRRASTLSDVSLQNRYNQYKKVVDQYKALGTKESPAEMYLSTSGELEARAVEKRMNMTPQQREKLDPYSSAEYNPSEAITMFRERPSKSYSALYSPQAAQLKKWANYRNTEPALQSSLSDPGDIIAAAATGGNSKLAAVAGQVGIDAALKYGPQAYQYIKGLVR